jgi:hypothetical protein
MEIDARKRKLEANAIPDLRVIFRNMANDAESIYRKNGTINAKELANNYYPEFLKEIRDTMRKTVREFGFSLRNDLQKKGLNFGLDFEIKEITDPDVKDKLKEINTQFRESSTFFIANQSEQQAKYIAETNAKEIDLAIRQEELKFNNQKALPEWIIIARNVKINLLDRRQARSELIASQVVGLTEAWTRQEEAEIINEQELEVDNKPVEVLKTWIAILDMKTRPSHASADFQQVNINDNFNLGGYQAKFPRDPNLPAEESINCRCIVDYSNKFGNKSISIKETETYKPTDEMARIASRALEWRKEYNRGGTLIGVARANQLKNKENLTATTVKRMHSFFSRHGNYRSTHYEFRDGEPTTWRIAWDLWGGDSGRDWAKRIRDKLDN